MNRRQALLTFAGGLVLPLAAADPGDYLLITQAELDAARAKADRHEWARAALTRLLSDAGAALAKPVEIPDRGGQWPHWYSCKKDGVQLVTDSPTRHRCPKCGEVYTGDPYDAVVLYRVHSANARAMRDMALAFRFTGRPEFARRTAELLAGYAARYASYPRHDNNGKDSVNGARIMSQTLDESVWLIPAVWAYALVRDTLAEKERKQIENGLLLPATDTIIGTSYAGAPNIQCWKDSAVGLVGFALGNADLVAEALDHPVRGFRVLKSRFVMPGGLWYEGTLGYHHYTMNALWPLAEAARRHGVDLYANEDYRAMFDAPISLALPDGSAPGFNDNGGDPLSGYAELYEIGFARWAKAEHGRVLSHTKRDSLAALLYGAESVPTGPVVPGDSVLMREAGFAVLRSADAAVALRFGIHGGGHGHPDKLNIVTFGAGQAFGLDPGSINYGVPLHREWYRSTIAHNTVSVDEIPQANSDGECTEWNRAAAITAAANRAYPGVTLRRSLRLDGATLGDRIDCEAQSERTFDWAFHAPGRLTTSLDLAARNGPIAAANGYQHIEGVREGRTDGEWQAEWRSGGAKLTLHVKAAPGTVVFTGAGPGKNPAERVPVLIVRRRAARTVFDVTHVFERA